MSAPRPVTVAAAQYPIEFLDSWESYAAKMTRLVGEAAGRGAQLLVLPEYAALELASLFPREASASLAEQLAALQPYLPRFLELHRALARRHSVYLLAASFPVQVEGAGYRNRAHLFAPDGGSGFQDKLQMTRFERERWGIGGGTDVKVFDTRFGRVGVNVCYDVEFPLIARRQTEAGAWLLLAPSCTDTLAGYHRVRIGCQARALENQCYVVQSPTVGEAPWSEAIDVNVGAAAVYTPVDRGFPDNGVLAAGELGAAQWVYALLEPARLEAVRADGQVLNHRDWPRHAGVREAAVVAL